MRTDYCRLENGSSFNSAILREAEKCAVYNELNEKNSMHLRLLAEEVIGMLPNLSDGYSGFFWIENDGDKYELHVSLDVSEYDITANEKFIALSKTGKNAATRGIVGKIRFAIQEMAALSAGHSEFGSGIADLEYSGHLYAYSWSLDRYSSDIKSNPDTKKEAWDELEKSVIAKLADDVTVGVSGKKIDIIIKKKFAR